jgi:hypothetical protein
MEMLIREAHPQALLQLADRRCSMCQPVQLVLRAEILVRQLLSDSQHFVSGSPIPTGAYETAQRERAKREDKTAFDSEEHVPDGCGES